MKKISLFVALLAASVSLFAWVSPISLPNVGDARLRIVSQNAENYHNNYNATNKTAWTDEEFYEKTEKMANVFLALNADIIVICEAGRNSESLLGYLANELNELTGKNQFTYVTDLFDPEVAELGQYQSIKTGFVYNYKKVAAYGNSFSPYTSGDYEARMRIQLFMEEGTEEFFYLSANHFKAKSGGGDQGESTRLKNVSNLLYTLDNPPTFLPEDPDILIVGDLNSYPGEQPILNLEAAGYAEQLTRFSPDAYTYIYGGEKGILDHIMANATMSKQITGAAAYNINNDNTVDPSYYYSDHDPVIVGLKLEKQQQSSVDNVSTTSPTAVKVILNGKIYIMHNGKTYNITGQVVK